MRLAPQSISFASKCVALALVRGSACRRSEAGIAGRRASTQTRYSFAPAGGTLSDQSASKETRCDGDSAPAGFPECAPCVDLRTFRGRSNFCDTNATGRGTAAVEDRKRLAGSAAFLELAARSEPALDQAARSLGELVHLSSARRIARRSRCGSADRSSSWTKIAWTCCVAR